MENAALYALAQVEYGKKGWVSRSKDEPDRNSLVGPMSDYPKLTFSMNDVKRAGKKLAEDLVWCPENEAEILQTFAIANSWRDSHIFPMRSVRASVIQHMRHGKANGFTAARPKRMSSIRKKLQRIGTKLDQINDLGGCRAVLDDIEGVRTLIASCEKLPHEVRQQYPYIDLPKPDGYRSHHMVFVFNDDRHSDFNGRRVELQIRTRLQHSWATAVEAVGLFRGEDMKAGQGSSEWLRLFQLMSAEFAEAENAAPIPGVPERHVRQNEIRQLNVRLSAARFLDNLKHATRYSTDFLDERDARYYLIRYDHATASVVVDVTRYDSAVEGSKSLGDFEREIEMTHKDQKVVLVEVDKISKLVEAYPNYFGDVSLFVMNLRAVCDGKNAVEYTMAPQSVVKPRPPEQPDDSWLRQRHRRWTE